MNIFWTLLAVYGIITGVYLISENRRPQSTLAWLLAFFFAPGIGVVVYILFGRHKKAFSKQSKLLMQDLEPTARPLLIPLFARQDPSIAALETQGAAHRKLMNLVRRNSQSALTTMNEVRIQQNGSVFYQNMMEDIKNARRSVHLQYFIWRSDSFTESLLELLAAKVAEGVEVRLLYDPLGSQSMRFGYRRRLRQAGVQCAPTTPLYHLHTISYRNHRKITVIDGVIGYTGGMNIGQEHLDGGPGFDYWRDTQLRIVGEGAALLQAVFAVDWYNARRENLFQERHFPPDPGAAVAERVPLQILPSGPDSRWSAIRQLYANMIINAEKHVYIQSPYFVPDATIAEALGSAALSGVDVKVMLSPRGKGDHLANWAANTYILDVMRAGVEVLMYQKGYLHAKTISIDSKICSIGSANIDIRSFSINYELNAVLYDSATVQSLEEDFLRDLHDCIPFGIEEYKRRSMAVRFRDSFARLFSPLL